MADESITITDNRTGKSVDIPIVNGGIDAGAWRGLLPGIWFYDPALMTTAAIGDEDLDVLLRRRHLGKYRRGGASLGT